jgi:uncharacterized protein YqfB (UPF0267 family)
MPALNFKAQFADAVAIGRKTQTIRAARKHPIKVGDTLYLYTGMRTKQCRRLRRAVCTAVHDIKIDQASCWIDGRWLALYEIKDLAAADGFMDAPTFCDFFRATHGLPFNGQLIKWTA